MFSFGLYMGMPIGYGVLTWKPLIVSPGSVIFTTAVDGTLTLSTNNVIFTIKDA